MQLYVSHSSSVSKSGRHGGGLMALHRQFNQQLWCKVCLNSDEPFFLNIVKNVDAILTTFKLLGPLAISPSKKRVLTFRVSHISRVSKSGRHDGGQMAVHKQINHLLWCKIVFNSDKPFDNKILENDYAIKVAWNQSEERFLLKYYIH